jgi:YaiO family outer membrane protein
MMRAAPCLSTGVRSVMLVTAFCVGLETGGAAQDNVLGKARAAAKSGQRAEALELLESHLSAAPADVDARLLYGLVLSWEGRYDEARIAFRQILNQAPGYADAQIGLMNVDYWSGNSSAALEQADRILATQPGNTTARDMRERLEAANLPWAATGTYTLDTFDDGTEPWHEWAVYLTRLTAVGPAIVRLSETRRFGKDDQLFEAEFYPRLGAGRYAYVAAAAAARGELYPAVRFAFDWYEAPGRGWEISGGVRYMEFDTATQIYAATLSKYFGHWMLTGKVFHTPAEDDRDSTTYHAGLRRYFGSHGTNYAGVTYSHGFSREEIYNAADLQVLNANAVKAEYDQWFGRRLRFFGHAIFARQEQPDGTPVRQTTVSVSAAVRF